LFNKLASEVGLSNIKVTLVGQGVTKIIPQTFVNLATLKAEAKHELLFNKPTSDVGL
jgi:hypothetical protein